MIWATKKVKKLSLQAALGGKKINFNETFAASHVHLMDHSGESSVQIIDSYPCGGGKNPNGVISWYFVIVFLFYWTIEFAKKIKYGLLFTLVIIIWKIEEAFLILVFFKLQLSF